MGIFQKIGSDREAKDTVGLVCYNMPINNVHCCSSFLRNTSLYVWKPHKYFYFFMLRGLLSKNYQKPELSDKRWKVKGQLNKQRSPEVLEIYSCKVTRLHSKGSKPVPCSVFSWRDFVVVRKTRSGWQVCTSYNRKPQIYNSVVSLLGQ